MTMTSNTTTSSSSSSPKNHTEADYGSIPTAECVKKATILDEMDPLVRERIRAQQQKKLGVAAMATLLIVVVVAVSMTVFEHKNPSKKEDAKAILDNRFASLLVDDQAFFFPSATSPNSHRSLEASDGGDATTASSENPWALAWTDNKDSFAAVGSYYHAKGKAIAHYYKSLYDPLYNKTAEEAGVANVTLTETAAPWTFDWKKDSPAAIAMSQKYKAIGDAIEDHYKQAFDPTSLPSESTSDAGTRRYLRGLKETSDDNDDTGATAPAYDWAADRDRGIVIGEHFKELGQQIKEHYEKAFGELANSDVAAPVDWSATWTDLKAKGEAIGTYYHDKGVAIGRFYEQQWEAANNSANLLSRKVSLWHTRSASIVAAVPASTDTDDATATTTTTAKNDWYIWGMDWQNGKEQAMNLHEEMKAKGQAIAAYYRAKFDPTFMANAAELISNPLDNLSFPTWGEDAEADKAHGKAIGEYWATHGKQVGKKQKDLWKQNEAEESDASATASPADFWQQQGDSWKERGQNIGKFWEDFYRSRFDPSYDSKRDLDY